MFKLNFLQNFRNYVLKKTKLINIFIRMHMNFYQKVLIKTQFSIHILQKSLVLVQCIKWTVL